MLSSNTKGLEILLEEGLISEGEMQKLTNATYPPWVSILKESNKRLIETVPKLQREIKPSVEILIKAQRDLLNLSEPNQLFCTFMTSIIMTILYLGPDVISDIIIAVQEAIQNLQKEKNND